MKPDPTPALAGTSAVKQALHGAGLLHAGDPNPVRLYATAATSPA